MHVLVVTNDYPPKPGGLSNHCYGLVHGFCELGHKISILATDCSESEINVKDGSNIFVHYVKLRAPHNLLKIPEIFIHVFYLVVKSKIKYILSTSWSPHGIACCLAQMLLGGKFDVTANGFDVLSSFGSIYYKILMKITFSKARKILVVSNFLKRRIKNAGISDKNIKVIYNGVDTNLFRPGIDATDIIEKYCLKHKKVILTACRLVEIKGIDILLRSMPQILECVPEAICLIVGDGPERTKLEKIVENLNLKEAVKFVGYIENSELPEFFNACDVFVQPNREVIQYGVSLQEGFGIVFLEAAACGNPSVGTKSGGVPEAVRHGVTGLLVTPEDKNELTKAIVTLLKNPKFAQELGENGRRMVENEFSWKSVVQKIGLM